MSEETQAPTPKKVMWVCRECGSDQISGKAYDVEWNVEEQRWQSNGPEDRMSCGKCGFEVWAKEVDVPEFFAHTCENCGGPRIQATATVEWCEDSQAWVVVPDTIEEERYCADCDEGEVDVLVSASKLDPSERIDAAFKRLLAAAEEYVKFAQAGRIPQNLHEDNAQALAGCLEHVDHSADDH